MNTLKKSWTPPLTSPRNIDPEYEIISFGFPKGEDRILCNGVYKRSNSLSGFTLESMFKLMSRRGSSYYIKSVRRIKDDVIFTVNDVVLSTKCLVDLEIESFEILNENSPYIVIRCKQRHYPLWSLSFEKEVSVLTSEIPAIANSTNVCLNTDILFRKGYSKCMYRIIIKDEYYRLENIAYNTLFKHKVKVVDFKSKFVNKDVLDIIISKGGMADSKDFQVISIKDIYNNCIDL